METLEMRPPHVQSGSELIATLDALQDAISTAQTYRLKVLAYADQTGLAQDLGSKDTAELISTRHRLDRADVTRDLNLAKDLAKYTAVSAALPDPYADNHGDLDDPDTDLNTAADSDGEAETANRGPAVLNLAQATAIINALNKVPDTVPVENRDVAETTMVEAARDLIPQDLRTLGRQVLNTLDTDGAEPAEDKARQNEYLRLQQTDHGIKFSGFLACENGELFKTQVNWFSKPHRTVDGELDPRSRDKRQADALTTLLELAAGNTTDGPGAPHITITIDYDDLKAATGQALGDVIFGNNVSASLVRMLACDAAILPIMLGSKSQPLDVGTEQRYVNRYMRRALIKRDKGCLVCKAPPPYCHAHHIIHWVDGGPTEINNLALFCGAHHHQIHKGAYTVTMKDGVPHVTRPAWADPPRPTHRIRLPKAPTSSASGTAAAPASEPASASDTTPAPASRTTSAPASGTTSASASSSASGTESESESGRVAPAAIMPWPGSTPTSIPRPARPSVLASQSASSGEGGIFSWLTPEAEARLNPWGEDSNAAPGP